MPVSLNGIQLPLDIQWVNEFSGFGVGQSIAPTITGALVVDEFAQPEGRRITLSSNGASWVPRSDVESLAALAATPLGNEYLTLVWHERTFTVVFDRDSGSGFSAEEVRRLAEPAQENTHPYLIEINLITVEPEEVP